MGHKEYEKLCRLVEQWNENRLDLFHLSHPTKELEVEGVMRFYFCDDAGRVCTKCIRVSSTATTQAVIEALIDKFLPDLKMLSDPRYSISEVHEGLEERKLENDEKPLLVQLNWHKDDKEGRFLLKKHGMHFLPIQALKEHDKKSNIKRSVKRFSKREKKEDKIKKKHKDLVTVEERQEDIDVRELYEQVPPTTFTRTISNPEIVMKKRREKKLECRLKDIGYGGSIKIYGGDIVPSRPYVTLLISFKDRSYDILRQSLIKYNMEGEDINNFELVQMIVPRDKENMIESMSDLTTIGLSTKREKILKGNEYPLMELATNTPLSCDIFFAIRRKTSNTPSIHYNNHIMKKTDNGGLRAELVSLNGHNNRIIISDGVTEVGSDESLPLYAIHHINLPNICSRHCVLTLMDSIVTITPSSPMAYIEVNKKKISQTVILANGDVILLGKDHLFRLLINNSLMECHTLPLMKEMKMESEREYMTNDIMEYNHLTPISITISHSCIWDFLVEVLSRSTESSSFPLSSSFTIYLSIHSLPNTKRHLVNELLQRLSTHLSQVSNDSSSSSIPRIFYWLSNTSQLYHLLSNDRCVSSLNLDSLSQSLQSLFSSLSKLCRNELDRFIRPFLNSRITHEEASHGVVSLLDSIHSQARLYLLNASITIQLSSQILCSFNTSLFNEIIGMKITSSLGHLISSRLSFIDRWANEMGVELAVECLLDTCRQTSNLLISSKNDMAAMGSTAYKLNSLQIRHLLTNFVIEGDDNGIEMDVLQRVIGLAERQADELILDEGMELSLEEKNSLLGIDMVIPNDGFVCDEECDSVSSTLQLYLNHLALKGLCSNIVLNDSSEGWIGRNERTTCTTITSSKNIASTLSSITSSSLVRITLNRGNGGIGLSIVAAQGVGDCEIGIYVKKVLEGTLAARDGRLEVGDELISVNEMNLRSLSQEEAAHKLSSCGSEVRFVVRKGAAKNNGLISFLSSPPSISSNHINQSLQFTSSTPIMSRSLHNESKLSQSSHSAFSIPPINNPHPPHSSTQKHTRSISTSDLYQVNDPNTSFSGRSIASTTSGFSALPSHYRRPTVIQPGRSCPSPSSIRHGAISPSILSTHNNIPPSSTTSISYSQTTPQLLSSQTVIDNVSSSQSPPIDRSSPLISSQTSYYNKRTTPSTNNIIYNDWNGPSSSSSSYLPILPPPPSSSSLLTSSNIMNSIDESIDSFSYNKSNEMNRRRQRNTIIDDIDADFSRVSVDEERRYSELMNEMNTPTRSMISCTNRKETLIDDIADYEVDSPSIVGAQEVYRDPRMRTMKEKDEEIEEFDGSGLGFRDKMRLFSRRIGENTPPINRMTSSSAQRNIEDHLNTPIH